MGEIRKVFLLGATGRTGRRVLLQLLERGAGVRAIVRSRDRLPAEALNNAALEVIEAEVTKLSVADMQRHLDGCGAVVSCLGHNISFRGVFGPPFGLVKGTVEKVCRAAADIKAPEALRLVLMSSVSVHRARPQDALRGGGERAFLLLLRTLIPPANDNQRAADFLLDEVGPENRHVNWVILRPDSLLEGEVTAYRLHDELVNSIFRPASTNMANVAHFMCELALDESIWLKWRSKLPVIVNADADNT